MTSVLDRVAALLRESGGRGNEPAGGTEPVRDDAGDTGESETGGTESDSAAGHERERGDRAVRTVAAVLQSSPEGLRKYTAALTVQGGEIAAVEPGLLVRQFQVREGGVGNGFVRVRAVDFNGEARHVDAAAPLFTVRFDRPVPADGVSLSVESATDHALEPVPGDRFRLTVVE